MSSDAVVIHPTALVEEGAELGPGVEIGPFAYVEQGAVLGARVTIGPHAHVAAGSRLAEEVVVFTGAAVGNIPQDLKFDDEDSTLEIGPRTVVREFCTLHRGTVDKGATIIGADCLLMAYVHIAHDCVVGDHTILANAVQVGGHVTLGDHVIIGGSTPVHQFCQVGDHAMIGGGFRIVQDVPPFIRAAGEPLRPSGVNSVGLKRRGYSDEAVATLKKAYRILFRSGLSRTNALQRIGEELPATPEIEVLVSFIKGSARGLIG